MPRLSRPFPNLRSRAAFRSTRSSAKVDGFFTEDFRCSLTPGGATMLNREQFVQAVRQEAERAHASGQGLD